MNDDILDLRSRLIDAAVMYHNAKRDAMQNGRNDDAEYFHRQYRQALVGFNSLGGGQ